MRATRTVVDRMSGKGEGDTEFAKKMCLKIGDLQGDTQIRTAFQRRFCHELILETR